MRKITLTLASATLIFGCSWINQPKQEIDLDQLEIDNTCQDLLYWLQLDLEEDRIDSIAFNTYSANIEEIKLRNSTK